MKKVAFFLLMTSLFVLFQTSPTCAKVIYDWTTYGTNPGDSGCGFQVTAQWAITEQEYWDKLFYVSLEDMNDKIQASAQVDLTDGTKWQFSGVPLYPTAFLAFWGSLSGDRTRINGIGQVGPGWSLDPDNLYFFAPDDSLMLNTERAWGSILYPSQAFNAERHPLTGNWQASSWDLDGEWVVRQETVPTPEPGTFVLLGMGLGAMALWRRRSSRCAVHTQPRMVESGK